VQPAASNPRRPPASQGCRAPMAAWPARRVSAPRPRVPLTPANRTGPGSEGLQDTAGDLEPCSRRPPRRCPLPRQGCRAPRAAWPARRISAPRPRVPLTPANRTGPGYPCFCVQGSSLHDYFWSCTRRLDVGITGALGSMQANPTGVNHNLGRRARPPPKV